MAAIALVLFEAVAVALITLLLIRDAGGVSGMLSFGERDAIRAIREVGGGVQRKHRVFFKEFGPATSVNLVGSHITDADLQPLEDLHQLVNLNLINTQVTDEGLGRLVNCRKLRVLNICDVAPNGLPNIDPPAQVTGRGLASLKDLPKLQKIGLAGTATTDEDVEYIQEYLMSLENLSILDLQSVDVSSDAVSELRKALPNCYIYSQPPTSGRRHRSASPNQLR